MESRLDQPDGVDAAIESDERLRAASKALFGNVDRLPVANAIARSSDPWVNATDLSWALRIANNRVRAQLLVLHELGLLSFGGVTSTGKRLYGRVDHPFWPACMQLYDDWSQ